MQNTTKPIKGLEVNKMSKRKQKVRKVKKVAQQPKKVVQSKVVKAKPIVDEAKRVGYDRIRSIVDAMRILARNENSPFTREGVVAKADELYVQHGGKSNPKESIWNFRYAHNALLAAEMIQAVDGGFVWKK